MDAPGTATPTDLPRARPPAWLLAAIALAATFGGMTLWALEGGEVVVLTTFDEAGVAYKSRVWVAVRLRPAEIADTSAARRLAPP